MPFISGNDRSGWAVVRGEPRHVAGVYETEQEANAKAAEMGEGYEVKYGRVSGDSDVDEAL
jgi:hypothetical protein